jgi:acetyltransferase-like isoleucine patch superfamily enzyme
MLLQGKNTVIYGNVRFGTNVILEENVIIGHPSAAELQGCLSELQDYTSVEQLYARRSKAPVVIGDNAIIRSGTVIYSGVTIGSHFDCSHHVVIREHCTIGNFVYIKAGTVIMKQVRIGDHCRLAGVIGDNSTIANNVSSFGFLTHRYARHYIPEMSQDLGPTLHEGCIVGRGAVLIGEVHVHEHAVVGANTLVNFNVPANCLVIGPKGHVQERKQDRPLEEAISQLE